MYLPPLVRMYRPLLLVPTLSASSYHRGPVGVVNEASPILEVLKNLIRHGSIDKDNFRLELREHSNQSLPQLVLLFSTLAASVGSDADDTVLRQAKKGKFFREFAGCVASLIAPAHIWDYVIPPALIVVSDGAAAVGVGYLDGKRRVDIKRIVQCDNTREL